MMNREDKVIYLLENKNRVIKRLDLQNELKLSYNTIRSIIDKINDDDTNGVSIYYDKSSGYYLEVTSIERFQRYKETHKNEIDLSRADVREDAIIYYLLQSQDYVTIDSLIEFTGYSRSTINKDLKNIRQKISADDLMIESRAHHGLKIIGDEVDIRKAFSKYVLGSEIYVDPARSYKEFYDVIAKSDFKGAIAKILLKHHVRASDVVINNIFNHIIVLAYRVKEGQNADHSDLPCVSEEYIEITKEISNILFESFDITLPDLELPYIAADIRSKISLDTKAEDLIRSLEGSIRPILVQIDQEFYTNFEEDEELIENLIYHLYPMFNRMQTGSQLKNPLSEEINMRYINVFTVALRFVELMWKDRYIDTLSKDEIGFLSLHFAASIEKHNNQRINKIKRIVVISNTGKGSTMFIRNKLGSLFTNAKIITIPLNEIDTIGDELPNLFLTTVPFQKEYKGIPVIEIKDLLSDEELDRIKKITMLKMNEDPINEEISMQILQLFKSQYFEILKAEDYIDIIGDLADKMVVSNDASSDYKELVIQREKHYPTIFINGIATPHPTQLKANNNTVGVIILKEAIDYQDKEIRMIFLINLKQKNLFLHQELQRLILRIAESDYIRDRILSVKSFDGFIFEIRKILGENYGL